jgi:hypothetical protein
MTEHVADDTYISNDAYIIAVTGAGENTGITMRINDRPYRPGRVGRVGMELCEVDGFIIDLMRLKEAAEKRLDGGVEFIAG